MSEPQATELEFSAQLPVLKAGAALLALTTVLEILGAWYFGTASALENLIFSLLVLLPMVCGYLVVRAQPRNTVGWLLLAQSAAYGTMGLSDAVVADALASGDVNSLGPQLAALWSQTFWPLLFVGFAGIAYVFPDGRFFNTKYRRWAYAGLAAMSVMLVISVLSESDYDGKYAVFENPLALIDVPPLLAVAWTVLLVCLASLVASAFAVRARLRASTGERRLQMLWISWSALAIPGTLFLCLVDGLVLGQSGGPLTVAGLFVMLATVPGAIAIGVLRYRLFDIEVVINRTLVYGALTLIVGTAYAGIVAGFAALIGSQTAAGVIGAGVVAVIVQPVYARLRAIVDRRVFGDRADPYAALRRLDERLKQTQAPGDVVQAVVDSVAESLRLPWASIEFEREGAGLTIAAHGVRGRGELERRDLWYRGELVGALVVEVPRGRPLADADRRLLDQLAAHVGAAVQSVRLTTDLQESRKELVTAREEERRRLRRDLHDGIGPSLAAMTLQLDVLRDRVGTEEGELVDRIGGQVQEAIADIRRLVYELRPPALDQYGLVSALSEQASRMSNDSQQFAVSTDGQLPDLSAAVEVAAYRVALEGMSNAARHAGGSRCDVTISAEDMLVVAVDDDGVGIDPAAAHGVGLRSMRERTTELGGRFSIDQHERGGTRLRAAFPMEPT